MRCGVSLCLLSYPPNRHHHHHHDHHHQNVVLVSLGGAEAPTGMLLRPTIGSVSVQSSFVKSHARASPN